MSVMVSACLPKQAKLQMALELVRKEMQEAFTQEASVVKKTVIWKVREYWGFGRFQTWVIKSFFSYFPCASTFVPST